MRLLFVFHIKNARACCVTEARQLGCCCNGRSAASRVTGHSKQHHYTRVPFTRMNPLPRLNSGFILLFPITHFCSRKNRVLIRLTEYRVNTKELYTFKMIQKLNAAYLELHTYTSRKKNSQSFVHTSQRLHMCSASHTADVETIIKLVPNFVQSVPSDGSYGSCDSLPCTRRK
jgi:hypothetical protein